MLVSASAADGDSSSFSLSCRPASTDPRAGRCCVQTLFFCVQPYPHLAHVGYGGGFVHKCQILEALEWGSNIHQ